MEPLRSIVQHNVAAPCKGWDCQPISKCRNDAHPSGKAERAGNTDVVLHPGKANPVENISEGEGQGGTSDHRVLRRGADICASTMPTACLRGVLREIRSVALDRATARVTGTINKSSRITVHRNPKFKKSAFRILLALHFLPAALAEQVGLSGQSFRCAARSSTVQPADYKATRPTTSFALRTIARVCWRVVSYRRRCRSQLHLLTDLLPAAGLCTDEAL